MSERIIDKTEEMASNADTAYETTSVLSTSSSSQLTKVRHLIGQVHAAWIIVIVQIL